MADVRELQRAATEREILSAVQRLLADDHPAELSMPAVAEAAGVSLRTLYRYFPTKSDLVDAASRAFQVEVQGRMRTPVDRSNLGDYLEQMWVTFAEHLPAVMAEHASPAGRELRRQRLARSRPYLRGVVAADTDLADDALAEVTDLVLLVTSSSAFLELTQHHGHDPVDAARMATWAAEAVIAHAQRTGGPR